MKNTLTPLLLATAILLTTSTTTAQNAADKILGTYRVVGEKSKEVVNIKITKKGELFQAQIIWMGKPLTDKGEIKRDHLNPDPALRSVPGDKIVIAWGLTYDSKENEWSGGKIYDPDSGKTYKAILSLEGENKLKVRGYIGTPALGKTIYWKKINN